jgi:hypothetical protein
LLHCLGSELESDAARSDVLLLTLMPLRTHGPGKLLRL